MAAGRGWSSRRLSLSCKRAGKLCRESCAGKRPGAERRGRGGVRPAAREATEANKEAEGGGRRGKGALHVLARLFEGGRAHARGR